MNLNDSLLIVKISKGLSLEAQKIRLFGTDFFKKLFGALLVFAGFGIDYDGLAVFDESGNLQDITG